MTSKKCENNSSKGGFVEVPIDTEFPAGWKKKVYEMNGRLVPRWTIWFDDQGNKFVNEKKVRAKLAEMKEKENTFVTTEKHVQCEAQNTPEETNTKRPESKCEDLKIVYNARNAPEPVISYTCNICSLDFASKAEFSVHNNLHRSMEKTDNFNALDSPKQKPGNTFQCLDCNKISANKWDHEKHQVIHSKLQPFSCPICQQRFSQRANVMRHRRNKHPGQEFTKEMLEKIQTPVKLAETHPGKNNVDHIKTEQKNIFTSVNNFRQSEPIVLKQEHERRSFMNTEESNSAETKVCDLCAKGYSSKKSLIRHRRKDHPETPMPQNSVQNQYSEEQSKAYFESMNMKPTVQLAGMKPVQLENTMPVDLKGLFDSTNSLIKQKQIFYKPREIDASFNPLGKQIVSTENFYSQDVMKSEQPSLMVYCDVCGKGFLGAHPKKNMQKHRRKYHPTAPIINKPMKVSNPLPNKTQEYLSQEFIAMGQKCMGVSKPLVNFISPNANISDTESEDLDESYSDHEEVMQSIPATNLPIYPSNVIGAKVESVKAEEAYRIEVNHSFRDGSIDTAAIVHCDVCSKGFTGLHAKKNVQRHRKRMHLAVPLQIIREVHNMRSVSYPTEFVQADVGLFGSKSLKELEYQISDQDTALPYTVSPFLEPKKQEAPAAYSVSYKEEPMVQVSIMKQIANPRLANSDTDSADDDFDESDSDSEEEIINTLNLQKNNLQEVPSSAAVAELIANDNEHIEKIGGFEDNAKLIHTTNQHKQSAIDKEYNNLEPEFETVTKTLSYKLSEASKNNQEQESSNSEYDSESESDSEGIDEKVNAHQNFSAVAKEATEERRKSELENLEADETQGNPNNEQTFTGIKESNKEFYEIEHTNIADKEIENPTKPAEETLINITDQTDIDQERAEYKNHAGSQFNIGSMDEDEELDESVQVEEMDLIDDFVVADFNEAEPGTDKNNETHKEDGNNEKENKEDQDTEKEKEEDNTERDNEEDIISERESEGENEKDNLNNSLDIVTEYYNKIIQENSKLLSMESTTIEEDNCSDPGLDEEYDNDDIHENETEPQEEKSDSSPDYDESIDEISLGNNSLNTSLDIATQFYNNIILGNNKQVKSLSRQAKVNNVETILSRYKKVLGDKNAEEDPEIGLEIEDEIMLSPVSRENLKETMDEEIMNTEIVPNEDTTLQIPASGLTEKKDELEFDLIKQTKNVEPVPNQDIVPEFDKDTVDEFRLQTVSQIDQETVPKMIEDIAYETVDDTVPEMFVDTVSETVILTVPEMGEDTGMVEDIVPIMVEGTNSEDDSHVLIKVKETVVEDTVPKMIKNTVPEMVEHTVPEMVEDIVPEMVRHTVPEMVEDTVPEMGENTVPEDDSHVLNKVKERVDIELENLQTKEDNKKKSYELDTDQDTLDEFDSPVFTEEKKDMDFDLNQTVQETEVTNANKLEPEPTSITVPETRVTEANNQKNVEKSKDLELREQTNRKLQCKLCPENFIRKKQLVKHLIQHKQNLIAKPETNEPPKDNSAEATLTNLKSKPREINSMVQQMNSKPEEINSIEEIILMQEEIYPKQQYINPKQQYINPMPQEMNPLPQALNSMSGDIRKEENIHTISNTENLDQKSSPEHFGSNTEKLICSECDKSFPTKSRFTRHLLSHTEEKAFVCQICQKGFTQKCNRNIHVKNVHKLDMYPIASPADLKKMPIDKLDLVKTPVNEDPIQAPLNIPDLVQTPLKTPEIVNRKRNSDHIGEAKNPKSVKRFRLSSLQKSPTKQCKQCPKYFTSTRNLKTHVEYAHEGVRHACNNCEYQAGTAASLKVHKQAVHEGITFLCEFCNYIAKFKSSLMAHLKRKHPTV